MFKFFSADDHVIEPAGTWVDRVPAKFRDVAPHVVHEGGRQWWEYEGQRAPTMGLNAVAGKPVDQWQHEPTSFDDMIPGCYDPVARAGDMLLDGIVASVPFPSLPRFGGALFVSFRDKELADVCVRAYNDWLIDEWCAAVPGMYVPMPIVQLWDPPAAAKELARCIDKGARAVTMPEETSQNGLPSYYTGFFDPIFRVAEEADIPVCMHVGSSGKLPFAPPEAPYTVAIATAHTLTISHSVAFMMSPIPRAFPNIKVIFSEGGIGWVPSALERADRQYARHRHWSGMDDLLPSEICARNLWFCMIEEPDGLGERHKIGVDKILWECDYPHADTPWPHAQDNAHEVFAGVAADEVAAITHGNAEKIFKWKALDVSDFAARGFHPATAPAI